MLLDGEPPPGYSGLTFVIPIVIFFTGAPHRRGSPPLDESLPMPSPPPPHEHPEHLPTLSVLVVDDDPNVAAPLVAFVRLCGHRAIAAYDGPAALEAARAHQLDVVLLDIGLPRL